MAQKSYRLEWYLIIWHYLNFCVYSISFIARHFLLWKLTRAKFNFESLFQQERNLMGQSFPSLGQLSHHNRCTVSHLFSENGIDCFVIQLNTSSLFANKYLSGSFDINPIVFFLYMIKTPFFEKGKEKKCLWKTMPLVTTKFEKSYCSNYFQGTHTSPAVALIVKCDYQKVWLPDRQANKQTSDKVIPISCFTKHRRHKKYLLWVKSCYQG